MRTSVSLPGTYGTPVAMRNAAGEWVEVGFVSNLDFHVELEEWMPWETPFRVQKEYSMSVDLRANPEAYGVLKGIIDAQSAGKSEEAL